MNNLNVNMKNRTIEMTKKFAAASSKFGTEEYKTLQEVRRDYPSYKVVTITRKVSKSDSSAFKGLTYEYMEKYIAGHDDEEKSIMLEYMMLRGESEEAEDAFAESASYQEIKDWFLDTFPAIAEFHKKREKMIEATRQKKEAARMTREQELREARRTALLAV